MTSRRSPRVRTPSADVERVLVDAAERVLARQGTSGLTVRAVTSEARVAPMSIYNRFGGMDGLHRELLIRGFDALRAALSEGAEADPLDRISGDAQRYRRFALEYPEHYLFMFDATHSEAFVVPAVRESADAAIGVLVAHVTEAMKRGLVEGEDPVELAQQVWFAVHGAVSLELRGASRSDQPGVTYRRMVEMFMRGLAKS